MGKHSPPSYKYYLAGFSLATLLAVIDGAQTSLVWGIALFFSGLLVVVKPPQAGLGKGCDFAILGFLAILLLSFIPSFYWPQPDWRMVATESMGIPLPPILSVLPWSSFESYLCIVGGIVWFYAAMQWRINYAGFHRLFFGLSIALIISAGWVISKHTSGIQPVELGSSGFGFFRGEIQRAIFFALGGIATFAYGVEGLRNRLTMPLFGLPATILCCVALYMGDARFALFVYFIGILVWLGWSFWVDGIPRLFKIAFPLVILFAALGFWMGEKNAAEVVAAAKLDLQVKQVIDIDLSKDAMGMVAESPLGGTGLGTFSSIFPQYRDASASHLSVDSPGSDLLSLAAEGGIIAVVIFLLVVYFYARRCAGFNHGGSVFYRRIALVVTLSFFAFFLLGEPSHHTGALYLGLLFAVIVLPKGAAKNSLLPPLVWRGIGALLIFVGLAWFGAGLFGWSSHSTVYYERLKEKLAEETSEPGLGEGLEFVEDWVDLQPLDWRAYFERAKRTLLLGGNQSEAVADFERARFVEPISGEVTFEEGLVWLEYDIERTVSAWEATLTRELADKDATFLRMLGYKETSPNITDGLARLSDSAPSYRAAFLNDLKGEALMLELRRELEKDPDLARFTMDQRTAILENWIEFGDFALAQTFLEGHESSLRNVWWLRSLVYKSEANFQEAVKSIREHIEAPRIDATLVEGEDLVRISRQFAVQPNDLAKGFSLLYTHLENEALDQALSVVDSMLALDDPPESSYYWQAEILYQSGEYIESWFAFDEYLKIRPGAERAEPIGN